MSEHLRATVSRGPRSTSASSFSSFFLQRRLWFSHRQSPRHNHCVSSLSGTDGVPQSISRAFVGQTSPSHHLHLTCLRSSSSGRSTAWSLSGGLHCSIRELSVSKSWRVGPTGAPTGEKTTWTCGTGYHPPCSSGIGSPSVTPARGRGDSSHLSQEHRCLLAKPGRALR